MESDASKIESSLLQSKVLLKNRILPSKRWEVDEYLRKVTNHLIKIKMNNQKILSHVRWVGRFEVGKTSYKLLN